MAQRGADNTAPSNEASSARRATQNAQSNVEPEGLAVPAWADTLTGWLDDRIRIPGTRIGVGLDAILGFFFPGLGDAANGVASLALFVLAVQRRIPRVVMARMLLNVAIDALFGAIPILGDVFDLTWKANRRNLELIQRHSASTGVRPRVGDYLLVATAVFVVLLAVVLPLVMVSAIAGRLLAGN